MAGAAGRPTSLWLRRRLKEGKKMKSEENPYASGGLETFAALLEELQAKRLAMVDKTAMSVSAVRSLSKSAQEWTASTLSKTVSKCRTELSQATDARNEPEVTNTNGGNEGEDIPQQDCVSELPKALDNTDDPRSRDTAVAIEGELTQSQDLAEQTATGIGSRRVEGGILDTEPSNRAEIAELPLKMKRASKKRREIACVRDKAASKAAIAVLVAVGDFFASKKAELRKQIAAAMTFSIVIRRWHNGKLYARYVFSAMASYLLDPLNSYLSVRTPKRLNFSSPGLQKVEDERQESQEPGTPSIEQERSASFVFPTLSYPSSPPSRIRLPAADIDSPSMSPLSPTPSEDSGSPSTNLRRRKLSLNLKSRFVKSLHLSKVAPGDTPLSPPGSPTLSSPNKHLALGSPPLSALLEMENSDSDSTSCRLLQQDTTLSPKRAKRLSLSRKPNERSKSPKVEETIERGESEGRGCRSPRKSGLDKMSNAPVSEVRTTTTIACTSGSRNIRTSILLTAQERREMKLYSSLAPVFEREEIWPLCGVLVALLFLLVGRVPAVLGTTILFLVLSQIEKLSSSRGHGHDKELPRVMDASRKLKSNSTPGSPLSPRRQDINSMEYRKRIIMEGLLERNQRSSG